MEELWGTGLATGCTGKDLFENQNITPAPMISTDGIRNAAVFDSTGPRTPVQTTWWREVLTEARRRQRPGP
jgi:hypothetical protein